MPPAASALAFADVICSMIQASTLESICGEISCPQGYARRVIDMPAVCSSRRFADLGLVVDVAAAANGQKDGKMPGFAEPRASGAPPQGNGPPSEITPANL